MNFDFKWDYVVSRWELLAAGLTITIYVSIISRALALILGLIVALLR